MGEVDQGWHQEETALNSSELSPLARRDYLLLAGFCLLLFGYSLIGGRALTMHEAVLPQSAREMYHSHDWIVPRSGGRPWLERPPLPQWITVGVATVIGACDQEWIVRIAPALMATIAVMGSAWLSAQLFGGQIGILSGLCLATMFQFCRYAWLAEQDIFLCAIVTTAVVLFAKLELVDTALGEQVRFSPFGKRSWTVLAFFVVLAMTNLAKGLLFGTAMVLIPAGGFLFWSGAFGRMTRYLWFWGAILFLLIAGAWPLAAYLRYPDVLDLWWFDHVGRLDGHYADITQPWWYYLGVLPWALAPWTPFALFGIWQTRKEALRVNCSPERFLWCWAILPPLVFSFASGKHHHYMLHCLAPWGILAAIGLKRAEVLLGNWLRMPNLFRRLTAGSFALAAVLYCTGYSIAGRYFDECRHDADFLKSVRAEITDQTPLFVHVDPKLLDPFRLLFYLPKHAVFLQNPTFLLDERIDDETIWIVTRNRHVEALSEFGDVTVLKESPYSRRAKTKDDLVIFAKLIFHPGIVRNETVPRISPMQSMGRREGPYMGIRL